MDNISLIYILRNLFNKLSNKRKGQIWFLILLVVLAAFSETLLSSAFPFLQIIIDQKLYGIIHF